MTDTSSFKILPAEMSLRSFDMLLSFEERNQLGKH